MHRKPSSDIWEFFQCVTQEEKMQLQLETFFFPLNYTCTICCLLQETSRNRQRAVHFRLGCHYLISHAIKCFG